MLLLQSLSVGGCNTVMLLIAIAAIVMLILSFGYGGWISKPYECDIDSDSSLLRVTIHNYGYGYSYGYGSKGYSSYYTDDDSKVVTTFNKILNLFKKK